jgi:23S rRNA (uridine2552-2'-O)-methyltransferase
VSARKNPYARPDARTLQARARGFPARSVFKLEEIDRRLGLLAPGRNVLDLGAAPGSWTLYASQRVGERGRVVAVDLTPFSQAFPGNVTALVGDVLELSGLALARFGAFDVVLSDMAPNTSGAKSADQARSLELFERALSLARVHGKPGSHFVGKLFMGPDFQRALAAVKSAYAKSHVLRPSGTRARSSEVFIAGLARR